MDSTIRILFRLSQIPNLKITGSEFGWGTINIEADGIKFDGSNLCIEDALFEAYLHITAQRLAKDLVKQAKITL